MFGLFLNVPNKACYIVVAWTFMLSVPVAAKTSSASDSYASRFSVGDFSSFGSSGDGSNQPAAGSSSNTHQIFQWTTAALLNKSVLNNLSDSAEISGSSWHVSNNGTVMLKSTVITERTSVHSVNTIFANLSSAVSHAQSSNFKVASTPVVQLLTSSGIITSPISSSEQSTSVLFVNPRNNTLLRSSTELVASFTKSFPDLLSSSIAVNFSRNTNNHEVLFTETLRETVTSSDVSLASAHFTRSEAIKNESSTSKNNISLSAIGHSITINQNMTSFSPDMSSYNLNTHDGISRTLVLGTVVQSRRDLLSTSHKELVSPASIESSQPDSFQTWHTQAFESNMSIYPEISPSDLPLRGKGTSGTEMHLTTSLQHSHAGLLTSLYKLSISSSVGNLPEKSAQSLNAHNSISTTSTVLNGHLNTSATLSSSGSTHHSLIENSSSSDIFLATSPKPAHTSRGHQGVDETNTIHSIRQAVTASLATSSSGYNVNATSINRNIDHVVSTTIVHNNSGNRSIIEKSNIHSVPIEASPTLVPSSSGHYSIGKTSKIPVASRELSATVVAVTSEKYNVNVTIATQSVLPAASEKTSSGQPSSGKVKVSPSELTTSPTIETSVIVNSSRTSKRESARPTSVLLKGSSADINESKISQPIHSSPAGRESQTSSQTSVIIETISVLSEKISSAIGSDSFSTSRRSHESRQMPSENTANSVLISPSVTPLRVGFVTSLSMMSSSLKKVVESESRSVNRDRTSSEESQGSSSMMVNQPVSSTSSGDIMSSEMAGISLIPIFTPCYVSYVITMTHRLVVVASNSNTSVVHNATTHSSAVVSRLFTMSQDLSSNAHPTDIVKSTTAPSITTTPHHTIRTMSFFESGSETQSASIENTQSKTWKLEPTPTLASVHLYSNYPSLESTPSITLKVSPFTMETSHDANQHTSILDPGLTTGLGSAKSSVTPSVNTSNVTVLINTTKDPSTSVFEHRSPMSSRLSSVPQFTLPIWSVSPEGSKSATISYQPSVSTLKSASAPTFSRLHSASIQSSAESPASQLTVASKIFLNDSSTRTLPGISHGWSNTPLPTASYGNMNTILKEVSTIKLQSDAESTAAIHPQETSQLFRPSGLTASVEDINTTFAPVTTVTQFHNTKNITSTIANSYHITSKYSGNGSSSWSRSSLHLESLPLVVSTKPIFTSMSTSSFANIATEVANQSVLSSSPLFSMSIGKVDMPSSTSEIQILSSLTTSGILPSQSEMEQHSSASGISPTPSQHANASAVEMSETFSRNSANATITNLDSRNNVSVDNFTNLARQTTESIGASHSLRLTVSPSITGAEKNSISMKFAGSSRNQDSASVDYLETSPHLFSSSLVSPSPIVSEKSVNYSNPFVLTSFSSKTPGSTRQARRKRRELGDIPLQSNKSGAVDSTEEATFSTDHMQLPSRRSSIIISSSYSAPRSTALNVGTSTFLNPSNTFPIETNTKKSSSRTPSLGVSSTETRNTSKVGTLSFQFGVNNSKYLTNTLDFASQGDAQSKPSVISLSSISVPPMKSSGQPTKVYSTSLEANRAFSVSNRFNSSSSLPRPAYAESSSSFSLQDHGPSHSVRTIVLQTSPFNGMASLTSPESISKEDSVSIVAQESLASSAFVSASESLRSVSNIPTLKPESSFSLHALNSDSLIEGLSFTDRPSSYESIRIYPSVQEVSSSKPLEKETSLSMSSIFRKSPAIASPSSEVAVVSSSGNLISKPSPFVHNSQITTPVSDSLGSAESSKYIVNRATSSNFSRTIYESGSIWNSSNMVFSIVESAVQQTIKSIVINSTRSLHIIGSANQTSSHAKKATYSIISPKVFPSPSLSLASESQVRVMATPSLSFIQEASSYVDQKIHTFSEIDSSSRKMAMTGPSESLGTQSGLISSDGTYKLHSRSLLVTRSTVSTTNSTTVDQSDALFTYYLIPTSTLDKCIAGYMTLRLPNVTVKASPSAATSTVNISSVSFEFRSPVVITNTIQTSPISSPKNSSSSIADRSMLPAISSMTSKPTVVAKNVSNVISPSGSTRSLSSSLHRSIISENSSTTITLNLSATSPRWSNDYGLTLSQSQNPSILPSVLVSPTQTGSSFNNVPSSSLLSKSSVKGITPSSTTSFPTTIPQSSVVPTSSSTSPPAGDENSLVLIVVEIPGDKEFKKNLFIKKMEEGLNEVYRKGLIFEGRRRKRNSQPDTSVQVKNIKRSGTKVDVKYVVIADNKTVPAVDAAKTMDVLRNEILSRLIGYKVLSRPKPAPKGFLAMLIKTDSQRNISIPIVKKSLEENLAKFYNSSGKGQRSHSLKATIITTYFEPLRRTYLEFTITVNNYDSVDQQTLQKVFSETTSVLTAKLGQEVLVAPYIPGVFSPSAVDYIIQNMKFEGVNNLDTIKANLSTKLTRVYLAAKQKVPRKRKRRALGSIDCVITATKRTKGSFADITYYIIDGGSILNATYACAILNRLTTEEMSQVTTPYVVASSPAPLQPTTSKTSEDDGNPSWLIPVILGCSVGFLLFVIIIILYCRWKKGAPAKKIQPGAASPREEKHQAPRMTHAGDPGERRNLHRAPPTVTTTVPVEENNAEPTGRPPVRKLPVRESSVRKKVASRENLIISQTTRTNPAFVVESGDESVTDTSVLPNGRRSAQLVRKREVEQPRKADQPRPPPSVQETVESDEGSETEVSDGESVRSNKDSVFTENTDQHSAAALPTVAVMSDTQPTRPQPPVRFRTSVHPEASLPPIDLKQTSLVGRIVEEEGPVQQQMKTKADIERWRNKQRQRDKKLSESQNKPGKRPSFTEKKAWSRAQKEIGSVLDPQAMQPIVRKRKRKPLRKYQMKAETTDDEENVKLRDFRKLTSPREEKVEQREQDTQSESDISVGEAQRRIMTLLDEAFSSMKSSSKKHSPENADKVNGNHNNTNPQSTNPSSGYRPPLYPRPVTFPPALPEPAPAHGRASAPSARHRRRFLNSQNSLPYPPHYYTGTSMRYGYPPASHLVTKDPVVVWDPIDKQRHLNQSSYRPYPGNPYTYSDPSGKLHFTPVHRTPDGMGGLVWSPYATEYAMEDFYLNSAMPGTLDDKNAGMLSQMQETPLTAAPDSNPTPRDSVIDMGTAGGPGTVTGESAEPLVRAIKDELFRLASGRTPVKHV